MIKYILFLVLLFGSVSLIYSQEICDNGLDDDNDGLIDLNDSLDCSCIYIDDLPYIPNPSFEENTGLPGNFTETNLVNHWHMATRVATTDYLRRDAFFIAGTPLPTPDGNAMIGQLITTSITGSNWIEYIGTCLPNELQAGENYTLAIDIVAGYSTNGFDATVPLIPSDVVVPIRYTIWGKDLCPTFPIDVATECPEPDGWEVIGFYDYIPRLEWQTIEINLNPSFDVSSIALGGPCQIPMEYFSNDIGNHYFIIDDLKLIMDHPSFDVNSAGDNCADNLVLMGTSTPASLSYQWYLGGEALVGQEDSILNVSELNLPNGTYTLVFEHPDICYSISFDVLCQEVCNNGIDDDGDGMIDFDDEEDCACLMPEPLLDIVNPSFELNSGIPQEFFDIVLVNNWGTGTLQAGVLYLHTDGLNPIGTPMPIPDGLAFIGQIIAQSETTGDPSLSYLTTCFAEPIEANKPYMLQLDIAAGMYSAVDNEIIDHNFDEPIEYTIWGDQGCEILPERVNGPCPKEVGYQDIGSYLYQPSLEWQTIQIPIYATYDITKIMLGGPCEVPNGYSLMDDLTPFFLIDNLSFISPFENEITLISDNDICQDSVLLIGSSSPPADNYQWLLNDAALVGQTDSILNISDLDLPSGEYSLYFDYDSLCYIVPEDVVRQEIDIEINFDIVPSTCGENNGAILDILDVGDNTPYMFSLDGNPMTNNREFLDLPPGEYMLAITDSNGCVADTTLTIPSVDGPLADAGPDQIINCETEVVILDGSGSSMGNEIEYSWMDADGIVISDQINAMVDTSGVYQLTVTDLSNGCTSVDIVEVVQDNSAPVANAGSDQIINCVTEVVILDGSGSSMGNEIEYSWMDADGIVISDQINAMVDTSGVFQLTVTDLSNGCTSIDFVEVAQDNSVPVADAGLDQMINCETEVVILDGSGSSMGNEIAYSWMDADGIVISDQINAMVDASGVYQLTVTDLSNGCTSVDDAEVTQDNSAPVADAGSDQIINCVTEVVILDGSGSSMGNEIEYSWMDADGIVISDQINAMVDTSGVYQLTVTDLSNGCTSVDIVEVVQDNSAPVANAGSDQIINCVTEVVILDGSGSSMGNEIEYSWMDADGIVISDQINAMVDTSGVYQLTVTDLSNGCTSVDDVEVTQDNSAPVANAGLDQIINCVTEVAILDGSGSSMGNDMEYSWMDADGIVISDQINAMVDTSGVYQLTVTDLSNGCTSVDIVEVVQDNSAPVADAGSDMIIDSISNMATLDGERSTQGDHIVYTWINEIGDTVSNDISILVEEAGLYQLIVEDTISGCTSTDSAIVSPFSTIDQNNCSFYIPNVFTPDMNQINDGFTIYGNENIDLIEEMIIFNRWGDIVFRKNNFESNNPSMGWDGTFDDVPQPVGVYMYVIRIKCVETNEVVGGDVTLLK